MSEAATEVAQEPIERVERPSREVFERDYEAHGKPVILTGVTDDWPALKKWGPEYFKSVAGDAQVRVPYEGRGNFFTWFGDKDHAELRMPFGELIDLLTADEPDTRYYLTEQLLSEVSPKLLEDVDLSCYADDRTPSMFMGHDTFMPCHFHGHTEALLCQLHADKQVTLFSPKDWARLYAHPWFTPRYQFSRVDPRNPDFTKFPKFKKAEPLNFTLRAGEVLYIPVNWWHTTSCEVFNFNVTYFWPSKRLHYPSPGLQHQAHSLLFSIANRSAGLVRALKRGS